MSISLQQQNGRGFAAIADGIRRELLRGELLPGGMGSCHCGSGRPLPHHSHHGPPGAPSPGRRRPGASGAWQRDLRHRLVARRGLLEPTGFCREAAGAVVSTRTVGVELESCPRKLRWRWVSRRKLRSTRCEGSGSWGPRPWRCRPSTWRRGLRQVLEDYSPEASLYQRLAVRLGRPPTGSGRVIEPALLDEPGAEAPRPHSGIPGVAGSPDHFQRRGAQGVR